jgi:penicillin-binding protein-related factor A (putative recombinase)
MQNVVPCSNLQRNQIGHLENCTQHLNKQFVQLAATNASSLNGLFLVTCRHLSQCLQHNGQYFIQLALQYKIACAQSLIEAISSSEMLSLISDSTIVLALFLAHDDVITTVCLDLLNVPANKS